MCNFITGSLTDTRTIEIRIMEKMKDYVIKKCAGSEIRNKFIPNLDHEKVGEIAQSVKLRTSFY
jgi:hypothetical protein